MFVVSLSRACCRRWLRDRTFTKLSILCTKMTDLRRNRFRLVLVRFSVDFFGTKTNVRRNETGTKSKQLNVRTCSWTRIDDSHRFEFECAVFVAWDRIKCNFNDCDAFLIIFSFVRSIGERETEDGREKSLFVFMFILSTTKLLIRCHSNRPFLSSVRY